MSNGPRPSRSRMILLTTVRAGSPSSALARFPAAKEHRERDLEGTHHLKVRIRSRWSPEARGGARSRRILNRPSADRTTY